MPSFEEYVQKGRQSVRQEAQKAAALQHERQEKLHERQAREQKITRLADRVRYETGIVTQTLVSAGIQPDQLAVLDIMRIHRASEPSRGMDGRATEGAIRRAERKRERLIARNSFRVWDMHSGWQYTEPNEPWDTTNHSYYLGKTGDIYYSQRNPAAARDTERVEGIMELADWGYEHEGKLESIRRGLGYLVARHNLTVDL